MINDLWYKNAIVYCLSVSTYMDADGDGARDLDPSHFFYFGVFCKGSLGALLLAVGSAVRSGVLINLAAVGRSR